MPNTPAAAAIPIYIYRLHLAYNKFMDICASKVIHYLHYSTTNRHPPGQDIQPCYQMWCCNIVQSSSVYASTYLPARHRRACCLLHLILSQHNMLAIAQFGTTADSC